MLSIKIFCFNWRSLVRGRCLFKERFWHLKELTYLHQAKGQSHKNKLITLQHAGMANKRREYVLHQVSKPDNILRLTICTISFGTGINKPYIELVVHWGAYGSVMDYRHEEDRTDRDSRASKAMCNRVKIILCQSLRQIWLLIWWPFRRPTNSQTCLFQYTCTRKKFILWKHSFIFQTLYIQQSCLSFFWIFDNFVFKSSQTLKKNCLPRLPTNLYFDFLWPNFLNFLKESPVAEALGL